MAAYIASVLESVFDFSNILNISISASWLVLVVLLLRVLLRKAPKWINVCLWGLVAIRLILPVSIESSFSLIPSTQTIPRDIMISQGERLHHQARLDVITNPIYQMEVSTDIAPTIDRLQITMTVFSILWLTGIAVLLIYTAITYCHLRRKVSTAVILKDNIFQSEYVSSPFVLGIVKPRIYLPYNLGQEEMNYVIAHERSHIRRRDHWWKPLGFGLLAQHWFNPLMWVAYILLCRDIELACDEKVIMDLSNEERADYTQALVACSVTRKTIAACPLAFGEVGVKERVKSVMNYKKPTFWIILIAIVACVTTAICFLTNPKDPNSNVGVVYYYGTVTDQAMSVIYEGSRESREYISLHCDNGEDMMFWASEPSTSAPALLGKHVMVRSRIEESTGLRIMTRIAITDHTWANTAEEAIENAILDINWSPRYDGMLQCADFVVLSNESGSPAATNEIDTVIYYGLALHQVFNVKNGELVEEGGSHIPTVLAFAIDASGRYILTEYWEPRDGSYYTSDIKDKFPAFIWPDTQKYIEEQDQRNRSKAEKYFGQNGLEAGTYDQNTLGGRGTPLSAEELAWFESYTLFSREYYDAERGGRRQGASPISCFFTSHYSDPRNMDAEAFLMYCPIPEGQNPVDEEEFILVQEVLDMRAEDGHLLTLEEMHVPCKRLSRSHVDEILTQYAGIRLEDMNTNWMEEAFYVPATDCFYTFTSDFRPGSFMPSYGEKHGDTVTLWSSADGSDAFADVLTLQRHGENWHILSFLSDQ